MKARYYLMLLGAMPAIASAAPYFETQQPTGTESGTAGIEAVPPAESAAVEQVPAEASPDRQAAAPDAASDAAPVSTIDRTNIDCVAKVIIHEAGNQSHAGKVAVAQVVRARLNDPRFPKTACAVIKQPGQFFNVDAYNPSRATPLWKEAVEIATDTLSGRGEELAPGALFFHAVGTGMPGRRRIAQIEGHVFYR